MENLLAQAGGLGVILAIWIAFANPTIIEAYHKAQWTPEVQTDVDYIQRSQKLRSAGLGLCVAVLVGANTVYPLNWLLMSLAFGFAYWLGLKLFRRTM